jgi:hypothetical protein
MSKRNEHFVVWSKRIDALFRQRAKSNADRGQPKSKRPAPAPASTPEPVQEST